VPPGAPETSGTFTTSGTTSGTSAGDTNQPIVGSEPPGQPAGKLHEDTQFLYGNRFPPLFEVGLKGISRTFKHV
jgi:hypothetical protein